MKERPILFSGPMVRAILEGHKTQTRRVLKPQPKDEGLGLLWGAGKKKMGWAYSTPRTGTPHPDWLKGCPYGQPGDRLWVRETFCKDWLPKMYYAAGPDKFPNGLTPKWKPSIHMPRWASRIQLEVTDVRVQRLQEISTEDIVAEGLHDGTFNPAMGKRWHNGMQLKWIELWDSINATRGAAWDKSPWVWAITFRRIEVGKRS